MLPAAAHACKLLTSILVLQLQQAIAASLLDLCCPDGDVKHSVELQAQQLQELKYYQQREHSSGLRAHLNMNSVPKVEPQLGSQVQIDCQELMGLDFPNKLRPRKRAASPLEKEEGSQASTTSAEPSLSAHETSGITLASNACSQPSCINALSDW